MTWLIDLRPCQHDNGYMDGQSQIKVHTDEQHRFTALSLSCRSPIQVLTGRPDPTLLNFSDRVIEQAMVATADLSSGSLE